jgi:Lon protease-like protein
MTEKPDLKIEPSSLEALRLFPLPETVLFPGTVLPLHIFEPRYRAMVEDALEGDRLVAIAMLRPGHEENLDPVPAIHPVVGVGRITQVQRVKDGRYYLALQGICRGRILSEHATQKPYRVARAERLVDVEPTDAGDVTRAVNTLRTFLVRLLSSMPDRAETLSGVLEEISSPGILADVLCAAALESADARQAALGVTNVVERLELATDAVAELMLRNSSDAAGSDQVM